MAKVTAQGNLMLIFSGGDNKVVLGHGSESKKVLGIKVGGGKNFSEYPVGIQNGSKEARYPRFQRVGSLIGKNSSLCATEELVVDEEEALEMDELASFRGLVLDIAYRPVNVVCWKRAICLEYTEKVDVLEYYDRTVSSPGGSFYIPAVLRVPHLLQVIKRRQIKYNLSRKSIFYRDSYTCQYCYSRENLTIDHVLPVSQGGDWKWENLVTACAKCNSRKGQQTLEEAKMKLIKIPKAPKDYDILSIPLTTSAAKMLKRRKGVPEEWLQYLPK